MIQIPCWKWRYCAWTKFLNNRAPTSLNLSLIWNPGCQQFFCILSWNFQALFIRKQGYLGVIFSLILIPRKLPVTKESRSMSLLLLMTTSSAALISYPPFTYLLISLSILHHYVPKSPHRPRDLVLTSVHSFIWYLPCLVI